MKTMIRMAGLLLIFVTLATSRNSYTGGYSGSPGTTACASCHSSTGGTIQISGFPSVYVPGQTYALTITHSGGNKIVNVNVTTRLGTTATVAGTFVAGSNSALYTGADGGIYTTPHLVDAVGFQWTAPASGSGAVTIYAAGFQATSTSTASGLRSQLSVTSAQSTTGVDANAAVPGEFALRQNYPNPFNPETTIRFTVPDNGYATLTVLNILGQEVATLYHGMTQSGRTVEATFKAGNMASGIYFSKLEFNGKTIVKKMLLTK